MKFPAPIPLPQPSRTELVNLSEADLTEISSFIALQSGKDRQSIETHLRWFLLENPARDKNSPVGFGLRSAGQLAGCILLSPQFFRCGAIRILFQGSSSFYVDEKYRGQGGRIFLQYCRLASQSPLFGTSANVEAAALWKAAGAIPLPFSELEMFGVLHWPPVAEEFSHRRYATPAFTRLAGSSWSSLAGLIHPLKIDPRSPDTLRPLTSAGQASELLIDALYPKLTAARDLPYLRWRYFSAPESSVNLFAFRSCHLDREILVTINQRSRGYRSQIRTLNLLDVYPEVPAKEWLQILGALVVRYKTTVDAIVLRNLNPDLRQALERKGFQPRIFDAPNGWLIDKQNLLKSHELYLVSADGDGLI
jgi:hypothetical protein